MLRGGGDVANGFSLKTMTSAKGSPVIGLRSDRLATVVGVKEGMLLDGVG